MTARGEVFFDVSGPYEIPRVGGRVVRPPAEWWRKEVDKYWEGLPGAIGCYMFCLQHGQTVTPWYVGMTVCKEGLRGEAFTKHKLNIYNDVLAEHRGRPVIFFFPLVLNPFDDERWRFSRAVVASKPDIEWLEKTLMGLAHGQNPDLANRKDMAHRRSITVRGIMGPKRPGRVHADVALARQALLGVRSARKIKPHSDLPDVTAGFVDIGKASAEAKTD